ncbi:MAG: VWA domain-containing protein [Anaerolineae bacterium]|nr:VWA domain-containing protein [Anaerolineae bacterium]
MAEITLQNPQVLFILPLIWLLLVWFGWRRRFKPFGPFLLRLGIAVLIMVALSQPTIPAPPTAESAPDEQTVLLVDQSASLGLAGQEALRAEAAQFSRSHDNVATLFFAEQPLLVDDPSTPLSADSEPSLNVEATNLAEALTLGANMLNDQPGRLVLLSDGLPTAGDALGTAAELARRGIPVDVLTPGQFDLQQWHGSENEVRVARLQVPPVLRNGETFDVEVIIDSEVPAEVTLNLTQNGDTLAEDVIALDAGSNRFTFTANAGAIGPQTFRATIAADSDRQAQNNSFSAFAQVYPPPRIMIVADDLLDSNRFASVLISEGFDIQVIRPDDMPDRISALEPYAGMVLLNVSASSFELEQMLAMQEFVRSLGRGLLVTGGPNSFINGAYEDTPLEELLPLSLEPPPREERPPVALLLVIDHSGSMIEHIIPATRLAMAKEAAIRATDILGPDDLLGILMFDNQYEWVVPFQQINDGAELLEVQQQIARIPAGGGTRILQALEIALPALMEQDTAVARHAVLLTDGKSFDGQSGLDEYDAIVDEATAEDITLSTIAIGTGADLALLEHLAQRGKGRYHFAEFPDALPALTVSESDILRSNALQEGDFGAAIFQPHPMLRGLFSPLPDSNQVDAPTLSSYLAMTPKPRSEVALQVGPGDPLLTSWGYGLGRVVAWSSDIGSEWSPDWPNWPEYNRFWGQVVGYTLPAPDLGLLQLETSVDGDGMVTLIADAVDSTGRPIERTRTQATLLTPGGQEQQITMRQVAPGRYERLLRLPDTGAYQLTVSQPRPDDAPEETATTGFVLPYPAEYGPPADDAGLVLLDHIARLTGGRTFGVGEIERISVAPPDQQVEADPRHLWPWFLGAALLLWPLEIAWRRWSRLRIQ